MIRLYDAHNHLQDERFGGRQAELIEEARAAGVARMVVNGSSAEDWPAVAELARRFPDIVQPSFGAHPWYIHEQPGDWVHRLEDALHEFPRAGVGEIGLDRWKPDLRWEGQREAFRAQLELAARLNRPVSIHCLKAWGPLIEALDATPRPACGFLLHSYGGAPDLVRRLADLGSYFSLPGYFLHQRKAKQFDTFRTIPRDRMLIETDAPDQLPPEAFILCPLRSESDEALNHPANLARIYTQAAAMMDEATAGFAKRIEKNFIALFGE